MHELIRSPLNVPSLRSRCISTAKACFDFGELEKTTKSLHAHITSHLISSSKQHSEIVKQEASCSNSVSTVKIKTPNVSGKCIYAQLVTILMCSSLSQIKTTTKKWEGMDVPQTDAHI